MISQNYSYERAFIPLIILVTLCWHLTNNSVYLLCQAAQNWTLHPRDGLISAEQSGRIIFCDLLATLCLMQLRTPLAFLTQGSTAGLYSIWSLPGPPGFSFVELGDFLHVLRHWGAVPRCKTALVEQHGVPVSPFLQPKFLLLWTAAQPSDVLSTSSYFVLCSLLRVCSAPESRSLTKMMNRTGTRFVLWDTSLMTCLQVDFVPLINSIMSLIAQPVWNPPHSLLRILLLREALAWTKVKMRPYAKVNGTDFINNKMRGKERERKSKWGAGERETECRR